MPFEYLLSSVLQKQNTGYTRVSLVSLVQPQWRSHESGGDWFLANFQYEIPSRGGLGSNQKQKQAEREEQMVKSEHFIFVGISSWLSSLLGNSSPSKCSSMTDIAVNSSPW